MISFQPHEVTFIGVLEGYISSGWAERGQGEVVGFRKCMAGCIESLDTLFGSKHTSANNNYCSHICDHDSLLHYIICAGGGDVIHSTT